MSKVFRYHVLEIFMLRNLALLLFPIMHCKLKNLNSIKLRMLKWCNTLEWIFINRYVFSLPTIYSSFSHPLLHLLHISCVLIFQGHHILPTKCNIDAYFNARDDDLLYHSYCCCKYGLHSPQHLMSISVYDNIVS